jgi:hypothetical protein
VTRVSEAKDNPRHENRRPYSESSCIILSYCCTGHVAIFSIDLSPASVVGHDYLDLFFRGVTAAVGTGDGNRIDASIAVAFPLGSK